MIGNFFQSLERHGVEYLLISGQATVLYGAATFSEDIDLWLNPEEKNLDRLLFALRDCEARYYKLTPPLAIRHLTRGHGFHFILPGSGQDQIFVDLMGKPPRVDSFADAVESSRWMETEWGEIHTIGIKPLVELKKTQRLEDYPIISRLALAWFAQPECGQKEEDFLWALQNIFTIPELTAFFGEHPTAVDVTEGQLYPEIGTFGRDFLANGEVAEAIERRLAEILQARISDKQLADRRYWREIIRDLKFLHCSNQLMPEGEKV